MSHSVMRWQGCIDFLNNITQNEAPSKQLLAIMGNCREEMLMKSCTVGSGQRSICPRKRFLDYGNRSAFLKGEPSWSLGDTIGPAEIGQLIARSGSFQAMQRSCSGA